MVKPPAGIQFLLMVNKQGQTRLAKWLPGVIGNPNQRRMMEHELVRKCMPRDTSHVWPHSPCNAVARC